VDPVELGYEVPEESQERSARIVSASDSKSNDDAETLYIELVLRCPL
jgi:hypothetical protein